MIFAKRSVLNHMLLRGLFLSIVSFHPVLCSVLTVKVLIAQTMIINGNENLIVVLNDRQQN